MDTEDDKTLLDQLQEALTACELQHDREKKAMHQLEDRLTANDADMQADLRGILSRWRQRRAILLDEAADVVYEIVGVSQPKLVEDRKPEIEYDRTADPLNIYARN